MLQNIFYELQFLSYFWLVFIPSLSDTHFIIHIQNACTPVKKNQINHQKKPKTTKSPNTTNELQILKD